MKKFTLSLLAILIAAISYSQSGTSRNLDSFNQVSAREGVKVYLTKGSEETARIEADGIDVEDVLTEVDDDELVIHLEGNNHRNVDVTVYVTYQDLKSVSASSAASLQVEDLVQLPDLFEVSASSSGSVEVDVDAEEVEVDVSSSGKAKIGVSATALDAEVSSAGNIIINGNVDDLDLEASSSGAFKGFDLIVKQADISASSGSSVDVNVTESLDAGASSGASINYKGSPRQVDADSSSGGSVRKS